MNNASLPFSVSRYCYRFMDAYRVGLTGTTLDHTVKNIKSVKNFLLMPLEKRWKNFIKTELKCNDW